MALELRQLFHGAHDVRRAFETRKESHELRLHLENDPGGSSRNERHISGELDGVAQPLLSVQQDGPFREQILAETQRLGEIRQRSAPIRFPPPLVLFPTTVEV